MYTHILPVLYLRHVDNFSKILRLNFKVSPICPNVFFLRLD